MSYLQRTSDLSSPFAQIYNSGGWNINTRPDTTSETWLSATGTTNGYAFTGQGYIFGFLSAAANSLARVYVEDDNFYTSGSYHYDNNQNWANSDDEMIGYGNDTTHKQGAALQYGAYNNLSRFNIIRIEAS